MTNLSLYELLMMAGGLIGVYVKLSADLTRLKSRLHALETQNDEVRTTLKELVGMVTEIKLLLARKGLDDK